MTLKLLTILFTLVCSDQVMIHLHPEQIINMLQSVISSDYLRTLANDFTKKAAEHLISEIKNQEPQLSFDNRAPLQKERKEDSMLDNTVVSKQQVLTLLSEPLPDGDNLEAEMVLSDEEGVKTIKETKVQGPMRINGAYYKRHFS